MLNPTQHQLLDQLVSSCSRDQLIWLSGYAAGKAGGAAADISTPAVQAEKPKVDIFYATETGNSKALSLQLMKALKAAGYKASNQAVNRLKVDAINPKHKAIFLASTHGEGTPPDSAQAFFDSVRDAPEGALAGLEYAIMGLGDASYEIFCGAATDLDNYLERLGGKRLQEKALFDVDYATHTPKWIEQTVAALNSHTAKSQQPAEMSIDSGLNNDDDVALVRTGRGYSRLEPIQGIVKETVILNDIDSAKQTYHLEITFDEPLSYTAGDAAGIILPADADGKEMTPRLYSIASSPSMHEGEIHLTVALATYKREDGTIGHGLASKYLAGLKEGDAVTFYISQNQLFNLPKPQQDAIMVGPGTGIAPFRSFVYERSELGHQGRNWVLFGDQHAHCDFLYQAEWLEHLATETVTHMDVAFSRDQEQKVYVQHKLQEKAARVMEWLEGGAAFYICGAKDPMSKDVEAALLKIIAEQKGCNDNEALDYLSKLEDEGRYVKDVY